MKILFFLILFIILGLFGFIKVKTDTLTVSQTHNLQPPNERAAQDNLPKARDATWDMLYKTKITIDDSKGGYSAEVPEDVKKLVGQKIKISGFMLPLESTEKFKHFLLSKRTPTCFFCPPGGPNEIIDVYADKETKWVEQIITYEGTFELVNNAEMGVFFKMTEAIRR